MSQTTTVSETTDLTSKLQGYSEIALDHLITFTPKIILAILILWIGFKLIKKVGTLLYKGLDKMQVSATMKPFITSLVETVLKIALVLIAVSILGAKLSGLITIVAAMGFAIGIALQGSLGNFASGILILFLKPYEVGDWIQIDDKFGKVTEIAIFNTMLLTPGNKTLIVPNSKITDDVVTNYSKEGIVRLELNVHIPYAEDFPKIREIIQEELKNLKSVLNEPAPEIGIENFDSHNITLAVRPYVRPSKYWDATFETNEAIKRVFSENSIKVAYSEGVELGSIGK